MRYWPLFVAINLAVLVSGAILLALATTHEPQWQACRDSVNVLDSTLMMNAQGLVPDQRIGEAWHTVLVECDIPSVAR